MKMRLILSLFLFMFLISFSSALTLQKTTVNNIIVKEFNSEGSFLITPTGDSGSYDLYTFADVNVIPDQVNITSGKSFELKVTPFDRLNADGFYSFYYYLRNKATDEKTQDLVTLKFVNFADMLNVYADEVGLDSEKVTIHITNEEKVSLKNVNVKISSVLFDTVQKTIDLNEGENNILIDLNFNRLKTIGAGSYVTILEFETPKKTVSLQTPVVFTEKKRIETFEETSGSIFRTRSITKKNIGNVAEVVEITSTKNALTRLFTKFSVEPSFVERKGLLINYRWVEKLEPQKTIAVQIKTNYSFVIILLVLGALLIYGYNKRYSVKTIEVKKSVHHIKTKGGEFALKVIINVKANKSVEDVVLTDTIPSIVKLYENFPTKPTRIDAKTRRIHWNIGSLGKREQRTFSYVIYSKVGVIGKFSLPEANLVYKIGQMHKYMPSNKVFFLSDQITREED